MHSPRAITNKYYNVQALRGLAAFLVVMHHACILVGQHGIGSTWNLAWGQSGVDIFFPISGFVMVVNSTKLWGGGMSSGLEFMHKRIMRIVPMYWLLTLLKIIILLMVPSLALHGGIDLWHAVSSFLFIPAINPVLGEVFPILSVGWTLSFEMMFYVLFAISISISCHPIKFICTALVLIAILSLFRKPEWGAWTVLFDTLVLEFLFGILIGVAVLKRSFLSERAAIGLLIVTVCGFAAEVLIDTQLPRFLLWGIPGAAVLLAAVSLEARWGAKLAGLPALLGDASYAIYLSHGFALPVIAIIWKKLHWTGTPSAYAAVGACLILSAIVGVLVHIYVEKPLMPGRARQGAAPALLAESKEHPHGA